MLHAISGINGKIPTRLNVGIMLFMACVISYMLRVNLSLNLIAMVVPKTTNGTNGTEPPDYGPRYKWSPKQQSFLLGAYFWGYFLTSLPAGMTAQKFGGRRVSGYTLAFSAIITALAPLAATDFYVLNISRFVLGLLGGFLYPSLHNLVSKWAPPNEKGKFVAALIGGSFGTVVTWSISGIIIEKMGWDYAFYVEAILTAIVCGFWFYLVADSPNDHPRIQFKEKEYIEQSLIGLAHNSKKLNPPIKSLLTSLPFFALLLLHYGNLWGLYFLATAAPKYLSEILGFNLAHAGILSSLPYLARMLAGFVFGSLGDLIRRKGWLSVTVIRKLFCLFSHIIPGILLSVLGSVGNHSYLCVTIITLSLGFNGASTVTNLQNSQDLAPNYAGTLYGIINFVGISTGFITPLVVGYFTEDENTAEQWNKIFYIGSAVYIVPAILFGIFGSGEVQAWNDEEPTPTEKESKVGVDNPALNQSVL